MLYIIVLACLSACLAGPADDLKWQDYKLEFGKVYSSEEEEATRYETWKENVMEIELHNADYTQTFKQGQNEFTDMTDEEFKATHSGCFQIPEGYLNGSIKSDADEFEPLPEGVSLPSSVNWVSQGYVTGVKNQARCGSCYSFSATGALEGAHYKKTGTLPLLSEQQIVDCSGRYGNMGCRGGWYQSSWRYIRDAGGNTGEQSYPYTARQGWCRFRRGSGIAKVSSYTDTQSGSEQALMQALATVGPVSVAIDASHSKFRNYRYGVHYDPYCSSQRLDHAVLAVGYGSESGQDYFLVKNSWGTRYGQGGYIKMARNKGNNCGIATKPSFVIAG